MRVIQYRADYFDDEEKVMTGAQSLANSQLMFEQQTEHIDLDVR